MEKYEVGSFNQFFNCICKHVPVYIEKVVNDYPIPELHGFVYPFTRENNLVFALCLYADNTHIEFNVFRKMIINKKISDDTRVKIFNVEDCLSIYQYLMIHQNSLFVLDGSYDNNIDK